MQPSSLISVSPRSPSFNSYSSGKLAEIAARVVREFEFAIDEEDAHGSDEEEEEFEFATVAREPELTSPISADDIFYNGQIRPIYPLFNTALLLDDEEEELSKSKSKSKSATPLSSDGTPKKPVWLTLGKFFSEDRETTTSCSSSEADEIENLPAGTYCVWNPKKSTAAKEEEPISDGRCKKSSSTGSSKRYWFRDLLYRSNSEGKEYVFLSPAPVKKSEEDKVKEQKGTVEKHYVKSRAGDKRRSFLPYKPDLVRIFLP